jgi:hypothetical protein
VRLHIATLLTAFALAGTATAAPIRVGILKGNGSTEAGWSYHHSATNVIQSILANPDTSLLGTNFVVPTSGFQFKQFPATGNTYLLSVELRSEFVTNLDSFDVVIFLNNYRPDAVIPDQVSRHEISEYLKHKGAVSIYLSAAMSSNTWPAWDSLHGTRFSNFNIARQGTIRLDSLAKTESAWRFLNKGLSDTVRLTEYWPFFTSSGDSIRSLKGLKTTLNLNEGSLEGGLGGMPPMGDHPISWYREFETGGRLFYSGLGYRIQGYTGTDVGAKFIRRQLYNAILWAAGVDSNGVVSVRDRASKNVSKFSDAPRIALNGGALSVSILQDGVHRIELKGLDGRRMALRKGTGKMDHTFTGLHSGVQLVVVTTTAGRQTRRVVIP